MGITRLTYLLLTVLLIGCKESVDESTDRCDFTEYEACHNNETFDSLELATTLAGKWKWEYTLHCAYAVGGTPDSTTFSGLTVEFLAGGDFLATWPSGTIDDKWWLDSLTNDGWRIMSEKGHTGAPHGALGGRIRVCDDRLMARGSYENFWARE